ncbi:AMP-dependent synthetase/ligase [Bradymonas sediminis]|uniref:Long-chain fatty acid--CoA ligase n=1 Tax=Bradymonas sediminis TaxID=1548548 RepID=A0A2Z4FGS7_9DELT|nr:AMP-binding protein [Bradymonas sediminis]AWV88192.1 long-chain fatty acid--CoA ligase [Bradymonas sediminis]TDP77316.1 long-chain acyl-CoA synthetase [Bradymonas sediminis]
MSRDSIIDRFLASSEKYSSKPAAWANHDGVWKYINWSNYAQKCRLFAGGLIAREVDPTSHVAILGANSPQWVIADIGAMMGQCIPTGIYATNSPSEVAYIVNHCDAAVLVVENRAQWEKFDAVRDELSSVKAVVMIKDSERVDDALVVSFDDFLESGRAHLDAVNARIDAIKIDDVATLIYTSGTTSNPKGVMLTHDNLAFTTGAAVKVVGGLLGEDCMVSYLPLSHIAEQMFTIHLAATFGYPVWYCHDIAKLRDTIAVARPTVFFGVPRVWEKFKAALENRMSEATGGKAKMLHWARAIGVEAGYERFANENLSGSLRFKYSMADRLVFKKIKAALGFDRLRIGLSSAAPIGPEVLEFFLSLDMPILEIYGQSEGSGPTTANRPRAGQARLGSVGLPLPDVQVKIAEDGEVLAKGRNIFKGYYKDEAATADALVDGWLHSGDLGQFDKDGFLTIIGRKKEIIITAGGKNIAPAKIEAMLKKIDGIGQSVLIGDGKKYLTALLTLDAERAPALALERGWPSELDALVMDEGFKKYLAEEIETVNASLARVSSVKKWTVLAQDFSIEGDELTPSLKVKRRVIDTKYAEQIAAMYAEAALAE